MDIKYGLAGVIADETAVSKVMPDTNSLTYRGYAVQDLASKCSFEEVAYLLIKGKLPSKTELHDFCELEKQNRLLSPELTQLLTFLPAKAHPMDIVRSAVSFMGTEDHSQEDNYQKAVGLLATVPTAIGFFVRRRKGLEPIMPNISLSYIDNFFHLVFNEEPKKEVYDAFKVSLILYAEHSFNASTFAARVITSTISDVYSAITGAIACLKGSLHGGANEEVMKTMLKIKDPSLAEDWILRALENKEKIMGFGHRIYRKGDSRVPTMQDAFFKVAEAKEKEGKEGKKWVEIYQILEKIMITKKNIHPNLDFPTGPAYYLMGFDIDIFTPIFVMSRLTGWLAHIFEQQANNKLIRPSSAYIGEEQRPVTLIEERS